MRATLNHESNKWFLNVTYMKSSDVVRLKALGGHENPHNSWDFPDDILYALQILREFPEVTTHPSAKIKLDYQWGFPQVPFGEAKHPRWSDLYSFQMESVNYLVSSPKHGSLLALSPGLGKSAVSVIASQCLGFKQVLVVSPLSLLHTWVRECKTWGKINALITRGSDPVPSGWVVTNYDTVVRHLSSYSKRWDLIILDESILVKNRKTVRYRKLKTLTGMARKVWLLSGSPISRAADDLFTQFFLIDPKGFKSYWRFAEAYCVIEQSPWGIDVVGSKDMDFQSEFRDLMFVRNQKDVLDLPEVISEMVELDLTETQKNVYRDALSGLIKDLKGGQLAIPNRIAQLVRLQEITSNLVNLGGPWSTHDESSKADAVIELLEARAVEFPMIIWTHWTKGAEVLLERVIKRATKDLSVGRLSADLDEASRDFIIQGFQKGDVDVLVLSTAVGKYGLTLTNARTVIFYDRTFSMDDFVQAYHRVVRIGLDHSPYFITLKCPGTVDDLVEQNLLGKAIDISKISDLDLISILESQQRF